MRIQGWRHILAAMGVLLAWHMVAWLLDVAFGLEAHRTLLGIALAHAALAVAPK